MTRCRSLLLLAVLTGALGVVGCGGGDAAGTPDGSTGPSCPTGQVPCGSTCADTSVDSQNCGTCGTTCPAGGTCSGGTCSCPDPLTPCGTGAAATCTDLTLDNNNCMACGNVCAAGTTCTQFGCAPSCSTASEGDLTVAAGATVTLTAGTHNFRNVFVAAGGTLRLSAGVTILNASDNVLVQGTISGVGVGGGTSGNGAGCGAGASGRIQLRSPSLYVSGTVSPAAYAGNTVTCPRRCRQARTRRGRRPLWERRPRAPRGC